MFVFDHLCSDTSEFSFFGIFEKIQKFSRKKRKFSRLNFWVLNVVAMQFSMQKRKPRSKITMEHVHLRPNVFRHLGIFNFWNFRKNRKIFARKKRAKNWFFSRKIFDFFSKIPKIEKTEVWEHTWSKMNMFYGNFWSRFSFLHRKLHCKNVYNSKIESRNFAFFARKFCDFFENSKK